MHHRVVRHLLGAERGGVGEDDTVARGFVQVQMVVAMAEGHQALATPMQPHRRKGGTIEPVALQHGDIDVAQRLLEIGDVFAFVAHDRTAG